MICLEEMEMKEYLFFALAKYEVHLNYYYIFLETYFDLTRQNKCTYITY